MDNLLNYLSLLALLTATACVKYQARQDLMTLAVDTLNGKKLDNLILETLLTKAQELRFEIDRVKFMHLTKIFFLLLFTMLTACKESPPEARITPYILQEGCTFSIITDSGSGSTTVEQGSPMLTMSVSVGPYKIGVSDCKVVENPSNLKIFVD